MDFGLRTSAMECKQNLSWHLLLWPACVAAVAVLLVLSMSSVEGNTLALFHQVLVSKAKVNNILDQCVVSEPKVRFFHCSQICRELEMCNVWCYDSGSQNCTFSMILVMPMYTEVNTTDAIDCYTRRPRDYATSAAITTDQQADRSPLMIKENLIDGIYRFLIKENFATKRHLTDGWFVLDLRATVSFSHVVFFSSSRQYNRSLDNIEVRVGMSPATSYSQLSTYNLFGKFPGPSYPNQEIILTSDQPVSARFVSVLKTVDNGLKMQVAHIEVY